MRRGRARARTPTAVASVGATAAPSTHAGPQPTPSRECAVAATAPAVAATSTVLTRTTTRRLLRISRRDVVRLSQYKRAGRNTSSTTSGGSCSSRRPGTKPISTPTANREIAGAIGSFWARAPHTSSATPMRTTSSRPSTVRSFIDLGIRTARSAHDPWRRAHYSALR